MNHFHLDLNGCKIFRDSSCMLSTTQFCLCKVLTWINPKWCMMDALWFLPSNNLPCPMFIVYCLFIFIKSRFFLPKKSQSNYLLKKNWPLFFQLKLWPLRKANSDHQIQQSHWPEKIKFSNLHTTFIMLNIENNGLFSPFPIGRNDD